MIFKENRFRIQSEFNRYFFISKKYTGLQNDYPNYHPITNNKLYNNWKIFRIRSFGSAALGLCYVACGRIDAYQCDGLYPWDAAAGTLIVREAGGHVVDSSGKLLLNYLNNPNNYFSNW